MIKSMKTSFGWISPITVLATCRDGGTKLIEYKGIKYHIDYRINTETKGCVYDDYPDRGKRVDENLEKEIQHEMMLSILR